MKLHHRFHSALVFTLVFLAVSCQLCLAKTVYVKTTGLDTNNGLSWATAKKTVAAGITASVWGDEIWVAAGTYVERITLKAETGLYGGFVGTETSRDQRNWKANVTVLDGNQGGNVVVSPSGATATTIIDGFTIRNGSSGISFSSSSPLITNNTVTRSSSHGISFSSSAPLIANNTVTGNSGDGIYCQSSTSPIVANNIIAGNGGNGLRCDYVNSATITNNTITASGGTGIYCHSYTATIANNIVAYNASGIQKGASANPLDLRNNCVYGNSAYNYSGLTAGTGDISSDPLLASKEWGNCHIQPGSPCRDAGFDGAQGIQTTDVDGQARIQGSALDIGADESDGTIWNIAPIIVRVSADGNDGNDGSSWALTKKTVQAGVDAACLIGGEVWLKTGTYGGSVNLPPYVSMYGGFAGTESAREERNWRTNPTVLVGGGVSTKFRMEGMSIDGFTLRNCSGSAVYCYAGSSLIIANNILTGNGGGVYCASASAPLIANNFITGSVGRAIFCGSNSSPTITNNTISGSGDTGIYSEHSTANISNNIVAFNASGIYAVGTFNFVLRNNCVFGNRLYNYSGVSAGTGDLSADPMFASIGLGNCHIQPGSPCRNAGYDGASGILTTEVDCQARVQGSAVDIGADESDGTVWSVAPVIVRVGPDGNDANDGSSWALAKKTVQAGLDAASAAGGEVWVKAGTYAEWMTLRPYASMYGGFAGTEAARAERNWRAYPTILTVAGSGGAVIEVSYSVQAGTIDGFTIRTGGTGIHCAAWTSPTITNNTISGNTVGMEWSYGSPVITNNTVKDNTSYGMNCWNTSAVITNNTVTGNGNDGIICSSSTLVIAGNIISGNTSDGIVCSSSSPVITNNTITGNREKAISCSNSTAAISNNIVAFNVFGIYSTGTGAPVLRNNCVYGNPGYNYSGLAAGTGDISSDPLIASNGLSNWHIQPGSPCRDKGYGSAQGIPATDVDGQSRVQGSAVDMGADESDGAVWNIPPIIVRVRPDGNNSNDGSSWELAKKTVQAGVDAASATGGAVWVKAGTYSGSVTLRPYVSLYGGFAGTESVREQRNWRTNPTILISSVTVLPTVQTSAIDGFSVRGAGTGISLYSWSSPTITNTTITMNGGAGLFCAASSSPIITNCTIGGNAGNGISCSGASATITNNTISGNGAIAIDCSSSSTSSSTVSNNVVAFNASGVYRSGTTGTVVLRNNCIYKNLLYNYSGLTAGTGDISSDPLFAGKEVGDCHIQPGSPCRDKGYSSAPGLPTTDMDGQARVQGSAVDIGADETDGTVWNVTPTIVRVSPNGNDQYNGSTWALAKRTVQAALYATLLTGGELWLKSGTYYERVTMQPFTSLYGGFAGNESSKTDRDWVANPTILDTRVCGTAVTVTSNAQTVAIDGLTIRNSSNGITCSSASPMIANNTIIGNVGYGISCSTSASPTIANNTLSGNGNAGITCLSSSTPVITCNTINSCTAANGGGISCTSASPSIANNIISGCTATLGGGIYAISSGGTISANTIFGNTATDGGGIYNLSSTSMIVNNIIRANTAGRGGGVYSGSSTSKLMNNTIVDNIGSTNGGGVCNNSSSLIIGNNIIAFNQKGVYVGTGAAPSFRNNCVHGNTGYDYLGVAKPSMDIATDPKFVNRTGGDYHVQSTSQCIDWGTPTDAPSVDKDGALRPQDGNTDGRAYYDLGVYEYPFYLAKAKGKLAENASFAVIGSPVTAVFASEGRVYIETPDRTAGIRVNTAQSLSEGQVVNVTGKIYTDAVTGERYVTATAGYPQPMGSTMILAPFALNNKGLGGGILGLQDGVWSWDFVRVPGDGCIQTWVQSSTLNNIGLLVTTFGQVTYADVNYFYLDDGSGVNDGSGRVGVKVLAAGLTFPTTGMAKVTGISTCEKNAEGKLVRLLRVRKQEDIAAH